MGRTSFRSWLGEGDIQCPLLPADILVCFAKEVRLSSFLLEELHDKLSPSSLLVCAVYCADQCYRSLVNQSFQVDVVDSGQSEIEKVAGDRRYRGKVAMEEDGV